MGITKASKVTKKKVTKKKATKKVAKKPVIKYATREEGRAMVARGEL